MPRYFNGVIGELAAGRWRDATGKAWTIPVEKVAIADSLEGEEAALVLPLHAGKRITVVSGPHTHEALGARVARALGAKEFVWRNPRCTGEGVEELMAAVADAEALVAVGSGTIGDSVKYGAFLTKRDYSVFATSPMNAYTAPTASVSFDGFKKSLSCRAARGVFVDLAVLARCPRRLVAAAFADAPASRTVSQVDWLLSHLLLGTPYLEAPYDLLSADEPLLMANAGRLAADAETLAALARACAAVGVGTSIAGTTHPSSMGEHLISHYIDMFAGKDHPGSSHGEQVAVASLTLSRLQNRMLESEAPPVLRPAAVPEAELRRRFGPTAETMIAEAAKKAHAAAAQTEAANTLLREKWPEFRARLRGVLVPYPELHAAMKAAGCPLSAADLGLKPEFYRDAVRFSRFIRDRYSFLDLAAESGLLESFIAETE